MTALFSAVPDYFLFLNRISATPATEHTAPPPSSHLVLSLGVPVNVSFSVDSTESFALNP
jgi:hypothetical protein